MQFFRSVNIDWIGKKNILIGASFALFVVSLISLAIKGGPRYGIDFSGGTLVYVKFKEKPHLDSIRTALKQRGLGDSTIQSYGLESDHEVIISLDQKVTASSTDLDQGQSKIAETLNLTFRPTDAQPGVKFDLNNIGSVRMEAALGAVPELNALLQKGGMAGINSVPTLSKSILGYRDSHGGILKSFDELKSGAGLSDELVTLLRGHSYLGDFSIVKTEIVGPKVGKALQQQAISATLYALGGMLIYIAWRFKGAVYGTAAVLAVFHDVIITLGFFSFFNKEISLTVIAALLTLVGYSMNDTIVVFDRIRENLKILRRESLTNVINKSINQTLSRTILTSGLTFITVLSLYIFGGEVINGFAFAMVIGIIIGTYSSIAIASPLLVIWYDYQDRKKVVAKAAKV
ncbi:MAG: protein translocase subunit SecF [Terriglobia bacterium]